MSAKGELFFPVINVTDCVTNEQYHFYADNAPSHVSASTREFIRFSWASVQAALSGGQPGRHCHFDPADQPFFVPLFRCDGTAADECGVLSVPPSCQVAPCLQDSDCLLIAFHRVGIWEELCGVSIGLICWYCLPQCTVALHLTKKRM